MSYHHNLRRNERALFLVFLAYLDDPESPIANEWISLFISTLELPYLYGIGKRICKLP